MNCRTLESEGDGIKSYVAILLALLVGKTPVRLIDEPETSLHPPQEYAIGQFIGERGRSPHHVTFVATHSSSVLRGILDKARDNVSIIRLDRPGGPFRATVVDNKLLLSTIHKPSTRAEAVLDGLFAKATIIVEADGDRDVYSAASERIDNFHRDIHFLPVYGTGGFAEVVNFYTTLRIPVAVIADLDLVLDLQKLEAILKALGGGDRVRQIHDLAKEAAREIAAMPPTITAEEARQQIQDAAESLLSWENNGDKHVVGKLNSIARRIRAAFRLKNGGIEAYREYAALFARLSSVVEQCKSLGLFLVPVGELESWLPSVDISRTDRKADWATAAVHSIREAQEIDSHLESFLQSVQKYLHESRP